MNETTTCRYIIPVFECFYLTTSVLAGAIYFRELDSFVLNQWIVFGSSVATTLFGVLLLSMRNLSDDETIRYNFL